MFLYLMQSLTEHCLRKAGNAGLTRAARRAALRLLSDQPQSWPNRSTHSRPAPPSRHSGDRQYPKLPTRPSEAYDEPHSILDSWGNWQNSVGRLDSANEVGNVISYDKVCKLGYTEDDIDDRQVVEYETVEAGDAAPCRRGKTRGTIFLRLIYRGEIHEDYFHVCNVPSGWKEDVFFGVEKTTGDIPRFVPLKRRKVSEIRTEDAVAKKNADEDLANQLAKPIVKWDSTAQRYYYIDAYGNKIWV